ncbi:hypothetical protein J6590_099710 [Homalodisca vitripennis]|nr:hypothetical protein J6590_099710 [Homalodisca vitripennis]
MPVLIQPILMAHQVENQYGVRHLPSHLNKHLILSPIGCSPLAAKTTTNHDIGGNGDDIELTLKRSKQLGKENGGRQRGCSGWRRRQRPQRGATQVYSPPSITTKFYF